MTFPSGNAPSRLRKVWSVIRAVNVTLLLAAALAILFTDWPDSKLLLGLV